MKQRTNATALPPDDLRRIKAALGWLELKLPAEALAELESLSPRARSEPLVMTTEWRIEAAAEKWVNCVVIAMELTKAAPRDGQNWLLLGRALRRAGKPEDAYLALSSVVGRFPHDVEMRVELALACAALDRLPEGASWAARAETLRKAQHLRDAAGQGTTRPDSPPAEAK